MSTVSFSALRAGIASVIVARGTPWSLAVVPFSQFDVSDVPDAIGALNAHGAFAVGLDTSDAGTDRQRVANGTWISTRAIVRFFARYVPHDGITSEDAALDMERTLIAAVVAAEDLGHILWESSSRTSTDTGNWFAHEVAFNCTHRLALT